MSDPLRRQLLKVYAGRATRRYGPSAVNQLQHALQSAAQAEADYFGKLSSDSVRSLDLQGGPMSADEIAAFRRLPHCQQAVRLRRYDGGAKDARASTADVDHFVRHVESCRLTP